MDHQSLSEYWGTFRATFTAGMFRRLADYFSLSKIQNLSFARQFKNIAGKHFACSQPEWNQNFLTVKRFNGSLQFNLTGPEKIR